MSAGNGGEEPKQKEPKEKASVVADGKRKRADEPQDAKTNLRSTGSTDSIPSVLKRGCTIYQFSDGDLEKIAQEAEKAVDRARASKKAKKERDPVQHARRMRFYRSLASGALKCCQLQKAKHMVIILFPGHEKFRKILQRSQQYMAICGNFSFWGHTMCYKRVIFVYMHRSHRVLEVLTHQKKWLNWQLQQRNGNSAQFVACWNSMIWCRACQENISRLMESSVILYQPVWLQRPECHHEIKHHICGRARQRKKSTNGCSLWAMVERKGELEPNKFGSANDPKNQPQKTWRPKVDDKDGDSQKVRQRRVSFPGDCGSEKWSWWHNAPSPWPAISRWHVPIPRIWRGWRAWWGRHVAWIVAASNQQVKAQEGQETSIFVFWLWHLELKLKWVRQQWKQWWQEGQKV